MRSIIDIHDLTTEEIHKLIISACDIIKNPEKYSDACRGKACNIVFEPSTRTRLSFEAAMFELGGNILSVPSDSSSSIAKGKVSPIQQELSVVMQT